MRVLHYQRVIDNNSMLSEIEPLADYSPRLKNTCFLQNGVPLSSKRLLITL